jgi:hypothetical protein
MHAATVSRRGSTLAACAALWISLIWASALLAASGCARVDRDDRPKPPVQPASGLTPTSLFISVSHPEDTNNNAYFDTIRTTIYIFSEQFPQASIYLPGSFEFALVSRDSTRLVEWTITEEAARAMVRKAPPGPGYFVTLSMLDRGTDQFPSDVVNLEATLKYGDGMELRGRPTAIRIGRRAE